MKKLSLLIFSFVLSIIPISSFAFDWLNSPSINFSVVWDYWPVVWTFYYKDVSRDSSFYEDWADICFTNNGSRPNWAFSVYLNDNPYSLGPDHIYLWDIRSFYHWTTQCFSLDEDSSVLSYDSVYFVLMWFNNIQPIWSLNIDVNIDSKFLISNSFNDQFISILENYSWVLIKWLPFIILCGLWIFVIIYLFRVVLNWSRRSFKW